MQSPLPARPGRAMWRAMDRELEWRVSEGLVPYPSALAEMEGRAEEVRAGRAPELVWLLEHPPLFTAGTSADPVGKPTAPGSVCGTAGYPACATNAADFVYEAVTAGPYVWHCHINSHEDSEMMRTSLVVKP